MGSYLYLALYCDNKEEEMQIIFAFTINPDTKEAAFSGNITPGVALQLLQDIVIAQAVEAAKKHAESKPKKEKGK